MPPSAKTIREDLARAKAAYAKNEDLRAVQLVVAALRAFVAVKLPGTDRMTIESQLREALANLSKLPRVLHYAPNGIPYAKGNEQKLHASLAALAQKIEADINRESLDAMRERKLRIDHAIIKGAKLLAEGNLLEAQRNFRAAVADYVDEKGLFPLLASKLIDAGHFKASLEYVKRAVEVAPDNARAYDFLLTVAAKTEEWPLAERILLEAGQKGLTHPLLDQALAQVEARLGKWGEAQNAAKRAVEADARLAEAARILAAAGKHLAAAATASPAP
ncbi:MAG: tetratricopeptide repeat protein [Solidesulfovibrio sp. DCME]|uniref:tetratricopeptide repeat protein n=1 Tax=Solidesulfovibrio sp. DCME TaxID=3447380 RepID=UPI003D09CC3F